MKQPHILLVEDEIHIAQGLVFNLEMEGYRITHTETGADAMAAFERNDCDLIVLDLMLPDSHGIEICRKIREQNQQVPVLMLTALGEEKDRIAGLREGADDYLTKPFSLGEFLLRVRRMLARTEWYRPPVGTGEPYQFGNNIVDLANLKATTARGEENLTELEGRMLEVFFAHEGEPITRGRLLEKVWGLAEDTETRTLDNFIVRLRKYFEIDPAEPKHFLTVRGKGYRFVQNP